MCNGAQSKQRQIQNAIVYLSSSQMPQLLAAAEQRDTVPLSSVLPVYVIKVIRRKILFAGSYTEIFLSGGKSL